MSQLNNQCNNINQKIDISNIVNQFIKTFYSMWITDTKKLAQSGLIKSFSSIKYENNKYSGPEFFKVLNILKGPKININVSSFNFIDSGSRRIDICVIGQMTNSLNITKNFTQTFLISHLKDSWFIKNSILIYF